jgi:hypothetical protein
MISTSALAQRSSDLDLSAALKKYFGFDSYRPCQQVAASHCVFSFPPFFGQALRSSSLR